jgi:hypothetical protein
LHKWLWIVLGIWYPRYSVCPGHDSPFDYLTDRYFNRALKTIAWACRSGGKSYTTGIECWLKGRFQPGWEANILGGSKDQSEKSYKATDDFWKATRDIGGDEVLADPPLLSVTRFKSGSKYSISTASTKSVHGPHQPNLHLDEIDEMDVKVLNGAMQQPQTMRGYPASWAFTSTMHRAGGLMSHWVDNAAARGYSLYKWCILEVMEPCYDYSCSTCRLDEWCQGKMKPAMKLAEKEQIASGRISKGEPALMGFNTVEDVIGKVENANVVEQASMGQRVMPIDVAADLFSRRPSRVGLVYADFDDIHLVDDFEIPRGWRRYRTFDFGFNHPFVCLYIAVDPMDRVYVYDEIYVTGKTTAQMVPELTGHERDVRYEFNVADPAGGGDRRDLFLGGIPTWAHQSRIIDGIQCIKNALILRADQKPGLYVNRAKCPYTVWEMGQGYRYPENKVSDEPKDANNHACDALKNWFIAYNRGEPTSGKGQYW